MRSPSPILKAAELAPGLGAIVLGAVLVPGLLEQHAQALLVVGLGVHGVGMTLKYRLEHRDGQSLWWERLLFWLCWISLVGLAVWIGAKLLAG